MGVSEPTVKRIFHERNCKLDRLMEICAAAGVELENVLGSMNRGPGPVNRIAPEIERKLAGRPALLFIFVMLSREIHARRHHALARPERSLRCSSICAISKNSA